MTSTITQDRPPVAAEEPAPVLLSDVDDTNGLAGRRLRGIFGEFAAAGLVAAVVSVLVQFVLSRIHVPVPSWAPQSLIGLVSAFAVLAALWLAVRSRFTWAGRATVWAGLSLLVSSVLALMVDGTKLYLNGSTGDNLFRVEYLTRLTDSPAFNDFAYPNMPGYYPRGWFWIAGRLAALLHVPGWEMYKPAAIASMAIGTVLCYVAWCLVLRPGKSLLVTLAVATVAVNTWAANEPYAWVFGALIPPLAAVAWHYLADRERTAWRPAVLLGVFIGLLGLFYTLLLGFFVFTTVITGVVMAVLAIRRGEARWPAFRTQLLRLIWVGLAALPLLLLQWLPYELTALGASVKQSGALRFLPQTGSIYPIFNYPTSFAGVLALIGLVWGLLRLRNNVVARALILIVACGYAWYAMSFLLTVLHLTLLPFKVQLVMDQTLRCLGVLGIIDGARLLWKLVARQWRAYAVLAVTVLSAIGMVGELQVGNSNLSELTNDAYSGYYPTGVNALGQHDKTQDGYWNPQLHDTIARLTGKPEDQITVLSTYQDFLAYYPYWNFQTTVLEYANPIADFDSRRAAIEQWARLKTPEELLTALNTSKFGAPTVFVFRTASDGLHMRVTRNVFPAAADNAAYDVVFPAKLFNSPAFTTTKVGPFTIVARR